MTGTGPTNPNDQERLQAVAALTRDERAEAVAELVRFLGDPNWRVRQAAVAALVSREGSAAVAAVLRSLRQQHRDLATLNGAIQVLTQTGIDTGAALEEY